MVIGNPPYKEKAKGRGGWIEIGGSREAPLSELDAAASLGCRRAREAPAQPVCLFLALGDVEGVRRRDRYAETQPMTPRWRHLLHHRRWLPERSRLPEDARGSPTRYREIWVIDCSPEGHQPSRHAHLSGCAAAGLHRAGVGGKLRNGNARESALPAVARGSAPRQVRGDLCDFARRRRMDGLPDRLARPLSAGGDQRVGGVSRAGRSVRL